jgi:hypothetical protein
MRRQRGRGARIGALAAVLVVVAGAFGVGAFVIGHHEHDQGVEGRGGVEQGAAAEEQGAAARLAASANARATKVVSRAAAPGWTSEQVWSATSNDWEPSVAATPGSSWVYEATTRYGGPKACNSCPRTAIIVRASSDGGATWGADHYVCACKGVKAQNDPELAVAADGTVFMTWLNDYNPGVSISKSTDHGTTWSAPVRVSPSSLSFSDKPMLLVSSSGQDVFVAWNSSDSYVSASHDGGQTFTSVKTNTDGLYWFAEGGAIAPNGTVFFAESAENQNATGPIKLELIRSTNGGAAWTTSLLDTSQEQVPCTVRSCIPDFFGAQANVAVDAAGKVLVLYTANDVAKAPQDLYVRTSTDNGTTFGPRQELAQNSGNAGFPVAHAGTAAGDFRIAWQDDRNGAGTAWNTWYRRTTDGGATWSSQVRLSDATGGAPYKTAAGYGFPYGDYFDLDVTSTGSNVVAWGEGPNYVGPGGTWFARGG